MLKLGILFYMFIGELLFFTEAIEYKAFSKFSRMKLIIIGILYMVTWLPVTFLLSVFRSNYTLFRLFDVILKDLEV